MQYSMMNDSRIFDYVYCMKYIDPMHGLFQAMILSAFVSLCMTIYFASVAKKDAPWLPYFMRFMLAMLNWIVFGMMLSIYLRI